MRIQTLIVGIGLTLASMISANGLRIGRLAQAQVVQPSQQVTLFENVTLSPSFSPDPITVRGISGGQQAASAVAGRPETDTGSCVGFVDGPPDHRMTLTEFFDYLSLEIQSPDDTTLVIRGPGGSWCNDDYSGVNPGIAGQWFSGTYEIWVGSYQENSYHPYVIRISAVR
ncbi:MAG: hypothetical protein ACFE0I_18445 [Elainellaceae cyanobacterium]